MSGAFKKTTTAECEVDNKSWRPLEVGVPGGPYGGGIEVEKENWAGVCQVGGASGAETQREEMKGHWRTWGFRTLVGRLIQTSLGQGPDCVGFHRSLQGLVWILLSSRRGGRE